MKESAEAIDFYWVLPHDTGFYRVLLGFVYFYWVLPVFLLGFTGFYRVLFGFAVFYGVLLSSIGFYCFFTGFYWVLLSSREFYWVLPGFIWFYRVLQGCI